MGGQFGVGQLLALAVFTEGDHGGVIVATAKQVLGEVQGRTGKPLGAGHFGVFDQHRRGRAAKLHVEVFHDRPPEIRALVDAPLVKRRVVAELHAVALVDVAPELVHPRVGDAFRGGLPEDVGHRAASYS